MKLDLELLNKYCNENNIELLNDYSIYAKINAFTVIEGKCINENCNDIFKKEFRSLVKTNGYCFECTKNNAKNKLKTTWLNKYGVEHISKLDHIKDKVKQTCIEKYGVECSLNNSEVKAKCEKTLLEKYGVEHASQLKETKEKAKQTNLNKYGEYSYTKTDEFKERYKNTCLEKYGVEHASQLEETKEKAKQTNLNKYGVESYSQTDIFKENHKKKCLEKYGVEYSIQTDYAKEQLKKKNLYKYGVEYALQSEEVIENRKQKCLEKFGVEHPFQSEEIREKYKKTCLEKYGVENSSQSPQIMERIQKKAYKLKEYVFPSGRIEKVQGYEPFALNDLLEKENIDENDIVLGVNNVPEIWYNDENNKKHRHYVDIFISSQNKCIEVKSSYTKKINSHNIFLKQDAAKKAGYNYELWIYDSKGIRVETHL